MNSTLVKLGTKMTVEEVLLKRVKIVGDGEWTLDGTPNDLIKELEDFVERKQLEAKIEAIMSLPNIKDGQYYFVSGKDIEKRLAELEKLKENE